MMLRSHLRRLGITAALAVLPLAMAPAAHAETDALNAQDRAYLQGAHQSNLAEIAAGKLAQSKGQTQAVKDLGQLLITDHTKLDAALRKVAAAANVNLPPAPNAQQRAMQAKMDAADAGEFDAVFVSGQIAGHAKTMRLGEREAADGRDAAVKKAAAAAAPVVAAHHHKFMAQAEEMGLPGSVDAGRTGTAVAADTGIEWQMAVAAGGVLTATGLVLLLRRRQVA
jgi:putative membrane protein